MSSGFWAGAGAADYARQIGSAASRSRVYASGSAALDAKGTGEIDAGQLIRAVQAEVFPYTTNYFRTAEGLVSALARLDKLWESVSKAGPSSSEHVVKAREASAMLATSRWMYRSALARTESRGMHKREDYSTLDPTQRHYLVSAGLDDVEVTTRPPAERSMQEIAA
jgi:succinate dehydrogenase/fumarate reductase flavoprotein subunit